MKPTEPSGVDLDLMVDQLYDIALDPQSLDTFIEAWNNAGLDADAARKTIKSIDAFDQAYTAHLNRAEAFLVRGQKADQVPELTETLSPFDNLAAFIIDPAMLVAACNAGAEQAFGMTEGCGLNALPLPLEVRDTLKASLSALFVEAERNDILLRLDMPDQRGPTLFQIRKLTHAARPDVRHALVVSTQYHWQAPLGQTLEEVFNLTTAEQGVVRALVEGLDAKTIAAGRGTSEGTVRGQIKSILSKMNARSQSEVIRLVLSLRDVSRPTSPGPDARRQPAVNVTTGWLEDEIWKPFHSLTLPDGRKLDYHDMGPASGAPVLLSHMGYVTVRWHKPMIKLAFEHGLRVIVPIRAGYGHSDNLHPKADVVQATRDDTSFLLAHLGISRLPYVTQGNDLIFAADFAVHHPDKVSEIIGICARPSLEGDRHYAGMGKWHRFFLSTAKHAPHLLKFTAKAAVAMAKRVGVAEMFRTMNQQSRADMAVFDDPELVTVLIANAQLIAGPDTDVSQAYAMEVLATESDWQHLMSGAKDIPTRFINGADDPAIDIATIAEYREVYPWIDIEVVPNAGQMLIYQCFDTLIPEMAVAAKAARGAKG